MTKAEIITLIKARTTTDPFQILFYADTYKDYCYILHMTYVCGETVSHPLDCPPIGTPLSLRIGKGLFKTYTGTKVFPYDSMPIVEYTPTNYIFTQRTSHVSQV